MVGVDDKQYADPFAGWAREQAVVRRAIVG